MEYNTAQKKLILPEYGRHVQNMVQLAVQIKDREERNAAAHAIIGIMGNLQPHLRDIPDFKHKLWDHLAIMSEFKLDIDSPYPSVSAVSLSERPQTVPYPQSHVRQKHYGKVLVEMIKEAGRMEEGELRNVLVGLLATQMRKSYLAWNRNEVGNDQIAQDIWDISDGKIQINPDMIQSMEAPKEPMHGFTKVNKKRRQVGYNPGRK